MNEETILYQDRGGLLYRHGMFPVNVTWPYATLMVTSRRLVADVKLGRFTSVPIRLLDPTFTGRDHFECEASNITCIRLRRVLFQSGLVVEYSTDGEQVSWTFWHKSRRKLVDALNAGGYRLADNTKDVS